VRVALAIGGLDPSAGAGIAADLRGMREAGAWGCAVSAVLTVQSTRGLIRVEPVATKLVVAQAKAIFDDAKVAAIKTGALGTAATVRAVTRLCVARPRIPLVVDPVSRPSRGAGRLNEAGGAALKAWRQLYQRATLLTPNLPEAEQMLATTIHTPAQARDAAAALLSCGARAVLLKGGHLREPERSVSDWLATTAGVTRITRKRRRTGELHGTGCLLASLIAGRMAASGARATLEEAALLQIVQWATRTLARWMRSPQRIGVGMKVIGP
jgi:hydroxymethylpyrimidine kinase/phosphomethylpyrimidine kinase